MSSLFGVELPTPVNFVIAFVFVLLLIGAAAWLVRRFGATRIDAAARGRQPRLAVIDSAAVDGRRKLVIIRRDNVEHLLMIGGPSDVVVETNIVRGTAAATRDAPAARNGAAEAMPRAAPLPDPTPWPLQPEPCRRASRSACAPRASAPDAPRTTPGRRRPSPRPPPRRSRRSPGAPGRHARRPRRRTRPPSRRADRGPPRRPGPAGARAAVRSRAARRQPCRSRTRPPTRASPRWRSASKPRSAARWRRRWSPKPSASPPPSKSKRCTPKPAVPPRPSPTQAAHQGNLEQEMASLLSRPGKT